MSIFWLKAVDNYTWKKLHLHIVCCFPLCAFVSVVILSIVSCWFKLSDCGETYLLLKKKTLKGGAWDDTLQHLFWFRHNGEFGKIYITNVKKVGWGFGLLLLLPSWLKRGSTNAMRIQSWMRVGLRWFSMTSTEMRRKTLVPIASSSLLTL